MRHRHKNPGVRGAVLSFTGLARQHLMLLAALVMIAAMVVGLPRDWDVMVPAVQIIGGLSLAAWALTDWMTGEAGPRLTLFAVMPSLSIAASGLMDVTGTATPALRVVNFLVFAVFLLLFASATVRASRQR
jgi:hypothetical protein